MTRTETSIPDRSLTIGGREFRSRLMVGTGKYVDNDTMVRTITASGAETVTVAVRRVDLDRTREEGILYHLDPKQFFLLANTAGCYNAEDAVRYARLFKELRGDRRVIGVCLDRPQMPVLRQRSGDPKRRVAGECADLDDFSCPHEGEKQLEQSPFGGAELDLRDSVTRRRIEGPLQRGVRGVVQVGEKLEDLWGGIPLPCP